MKKREALELVLFSFLMVVIQSSSASAGGVVGVGSGVFVPWSGDPGYSISGQILGSIASDHLRIGGEFEYRRFDTKLEGGLFSGPFSKTTYDNYNLRFLISGHLIPDKMFSPYFGGGFNVAIWSVDSRARTYRDRVSGGFGMLALAGFEIQLGVPHLVGYGEARVGFNLDDWRDEANKSDEIDESGGFTGMGGVRFKF